MASAPRNLHRVSVSYDGPVNGDSILVSRDGVRLVEGRDYTIGYDASNNVLRFTPTAGIWGRQFDLHRQRAWPIR